MKDRVKKGLELFVFFFKIGCFTFGGGWSILAQMEQEFVDKRKWLTKSELLDMVAVGRSVPGIMITNISMIFGYSVGGVFGGFCAVLGITTPAILILSIVTMFYSKLKDNVWCASALRGIRSAVVQCCFFSWKRGIQDENFSGSRSHCIIIMCFYEYWEYRAGRTWRRLCGNLAAVFRSE